MSNNGVEVQLSDLREQNALLQLQVQQLLQQTAELTDRIVGTAPLIDKIVEAASPDIDIVTTTSVCEQPTSELSVLTQRVDHLDQEVAALKNRRPYHRHRSRSRSRSRLNSSENHDSDDEYVCWYHRRFYEFSTKCTAPCSFKFNWNKQTQNGAEYQSSSIAGQPSTVSAKSIPQKRLCFMRENNI